jgi:addiction module RelE/StbE family toxin
MAWRIIWSQTAYEDLKEIVEFIAADNSVAAAKLAEHIFEHIERASVLPQAQRVVPEKGDDSIREAILKPYRIIYLTDRTQHAIHILRIWHASRGIPDIEND